MKKEKAKSKVRQRPKRKVKGESILMAVNN